MIAMHTFAIHARCPYVAKLQWDYYDVEVTTEDEIDVHKLEEVMNSVRDSSMSQEQIALALKQQLPGHCFIEVRGRHTQNSSTVVRA